MPRLSRVALRAESLIRELGITSAKDIDIEAIAFDQGIEVEYEALSGCEATLVGFDNAAIATISPSGSRGRERFSVAHETGHWLLHRGRSFQCRVADFVENYASDRQAEKEADEFASHLLMPTDIFLPAIRALNIPSLPKLQGIANEFEVSLQAVSIRMATLDTLPVIVACYTKYGLKWRIRASHIPSRWSLRQKLDDDSFAYSILYEGQTQKMGKQPGETWFENDDAEDYELLESSIPSVSGQVLVLLYLTDSRMCEARAFQRNF